MVIDLFSRQVVGWSLRGDMASAIVIDTLRIGSRRVERLHGQRFVTQRQAKDEAIGWLLWYKARLHSTLADVSPLL